MKWKVLPATKNCPYYQEFFKIRNEELRIPLGMELTDQDIEQDNNQICIYGIHSNQITCGLMLVEQEQATYKMRQVATVKQHQRSGLGKQLIAYTEGYLNGLGGQTIHLHARKNVAPFYTQLGYEIVGNEFEEVGIPHVFMQKTL